MAVVGGPAREITIKGRSFGVPHDAEVTIVLGGDNNTVEPNGDGVTARIVKEKSAWKISGATLVIDDSKNDHQFLQDVVDGFEFVDIAVAMSNGDIYYGQGTIVEESERSVKSATMDVTASGPGRMTKQ